MSKFRSFIVSLGLIVWVFGVGMLIAVLRRTGVIARRIARSPFGGHMRISAAVISRFTAAWFYAQFCSHLQVGAFVMVLMIVIALVFSAMYALMFSDQLDKPRVWQTMKWTAAFALVGNLYWIVSSAIPNAWYYTTAGVGTIFSAGFFLALYFVWRIVEAHPQSDTGVEFAPLR